MIKARLLVVDSALLNPTVMMRRDFVHQHAIRYDANFPRDHDHRFFCRDAALRCGAVFHSLDDALLRYRRHAGNLTQNRDGADAEKTRVREALWPLFFPELSASEAGLLLKVLCEKVQLDYLDAFDAVAACNKAMREQRCFYGEDREELRRIIGAARQKLLSVFEVKHTGAA